MVRKAKNRYTWHGLARLTSALQKLRESGIEEYGDSLSLLSIDDADSPVGAVARGASGDDDGDDGAKDNAGDAGEGGAAAGRLDCRRERSLCLLSQVRTLFWSQYDLQTRQASALLAWRPDSTDTPSRVVGRTPCTPMFPPAQKFVQLFLISKSNTVSLEAAARTLLGGSSADPAKLKTKVGDRTARTDPAYTAPRHDARSIAICRCDG